MRYKRVCFVLGVLNSGCGGEGDGDSGPLRETLVSTCEYVMADNCYTRMVEQARSCLSGISAGTLSWDRKLCEYANSVSTELGDSLPLPTSGFSTYRWDVTVKSGDGICASVVEGDASDFDFVFTVRQMKYTQTFKEGNIHVVCPDRTAFRMDAGDVFECLNGLPGVSGGVGFDHVSAWMSARTVADRAPLLNCDVIQ